ncbi:hypothetical protein [Aeromonas hydrophila]|uniref:hypothetical protein n=1 Tax=Aeromonas hydrophila TaxID=644 RepID=UPI00214F5D13|nr:hypothetical protein [Aeromonas hydrophila]MCR3953542.1 hypothetical protein [Aeromonas hydrophila]MCW4616361.1 hypothetical protein [Aeromonas hydrophila]
MTSDSVRIEKFRDLYLTIPDTKNVSEFFDNLGANLGDPWYRDANKEKEFDFITGDKAFCFVRNSDDALPSAGLTIFNKKNNEWYVPNIVPRECNELGIDLYNAILLDFWNSIKDISVRAGVDVKITDSALSDESLLGAVGAKCLRAFSLLANKSTGSSHPSDRKRWFDFILNTYHLDTFSIEDLIEILKKQGWPENIAHRLAAEYEFAQELLSYAKE